MTYCCENIRRAYELIDNAQNKLNWRPEGFGFGDFVGGVFTLNTSTGVKVSKYLSRAIDEMIDAFKILNQAKNAIDACSCASEKESNALVLRNETERRIGNIQQALIRGSQEFSRVNAENSGLQRQLEIREEQINLGRRLLDDSRDLITRVQGQIERKDNQLVLLNNQLTNLSVENATNRSQLISTREQLTDTRNELVQRLQDLRDLAGRFNDLQVENAINENQAQLMSRQYETTYNQLRLSLEGNRNLLQENRNLAVSSAINETRAELFEDQLGIVGNRLERTEDRLIVRETQLDTLREEFVNIRIENALNEREKTILQRDLDERLSPQEMQFILSDYERRLANERQNLREIQRELERIRAERDERITPLELQELLHLNELQFQEKEREIREKELEIATLRSQLDQSQEGNVAEKIRSAEQKLEAFAHRLAINLQQIRSLRNAYEQLIRAKRNYNRNNILNAEKDIETIKDEFIRMRVRIENLQEICERCEKVAELRVQLEQQLEARIEVPTHN